MLFECCGLRECLSECKQAPVLALPIDDVLEVSRGSELRMTWWLGLSMLTSPSNGAVRVVRGASIEDNPSLLRHEGSAAFASDDRNHEVCC